MGHPAGRRFQSCNFLTLRKSANYTLIKGCETLVLLTIGSLARRESRVSRVPLGYVHPIQGPESTGPTRRTGFGGVRFMLEHSFFERKQVLMAGCLRAFPRS
jgi:hypothetical protein